METKIKSIDEDKKLKPSIRASEIVLEVTGQQKAVNLNLGKSIDTINAADPSGDINFSEQCGCPLT